MITVEADERSKPEASADRQTLLLTIGLVAGVIVFTMLLFSVALLNAVIGSRAEQGSIAATAASLEAERVQAAAAVAVQAGGARSPREREAIGLQMSDVAPQVTSGIDAFRSGGTIHDYDGASVRLVPLTNEKLRPLLETAASDWQATSAITSDITAARPVDRTTLPAAQTSFRNATADFQRFQRAIVYETEIGNLASATVRNALTALAVFTFLFIVASLLGRVRRSQVRLTENAAALERRNAELELASDSLAQAKAGTDTIMETVSQGLFLITPDFKVTGQYSRELEQIFRLPALEGANLLNLLQRLLTERMFNTAKRYLTLLFDKSKKQRTLLQVNPLAQIEVNFPNPEGGYSLRYLSFAFRRIVENREIARVFVAVNDVTQRVELETQLRLSEARKNRQFELLLSVLYVEPREIDEFISIAGQQLENINTALRTQDFVGAASGGMAALRQRLEAVFRSVHTIKGNAQMMNLPYFVTACQQFEATIVLLRNRSALGGDDFLTIAFEQANLAKDVEELQEVRQRFVGMRSLATQQPPIERVASPGNDLVESVTELATSIAAVSGKVVDVQFSDFDPERLDPTRRRAVRDILIQLVRNSVAHGVESPDERFLVGKPARATIAIAGVPAPGTFSFSFRDDGRGLDTDKIKASAIKAGIRTADEIAALAPAQAAGLIFAPGLSTASTVTADAGRGVGMDIVKDLVIDRFGGKISVRSTPAQFTEFTFMIPLASNGATENHVLAGVP